MTGPASTTSTTDQDIVLTRVLDVPREVAWRAWTDPALLSRWWGPTGYTAPACTIDLREGGKYHICMRAPDGKDYWSTGFYREVSEPERLVFTDSFADADGNLISGAVYGMDELPLEMLFTLTLDELGPMQTRMTLHHSGMPAGEHRDMAIQGLSQSFDKMAVAIANATYIRTEGDLDLVMSRLLDAPRELVWKAWTEPAQMRQWLGPRELTTTLCEVDLRAGGSYRFVHADPSGAEFVFRGVYREIVAPERLVHTFIFEGMPDNEAVVVATFQDIGGKTLVTERTRFDVAASREGAIAGGMPAGMDESMDRLAELLAAAK